MIDFTCDYSSGAHPRVMAALTAANDLHMPGYGLDNVTREAKRTVLETCVLSPDDDGARVFFLNGGTQTNAVALDALLTHCQGVVCASTAHIAVHEAGAIEASGHKVLTIPSKDGKIDAETLERYVKEFYADDTWRHMVQPGAVYVTQPTELGTLYTLRQLADIRDVCHTYKMPLYVDGARLAYALGSDANDISLPQLAKTADMFYIGGTKCGAMFGEALVVKNARYKPWLFSLIKLHGALLAKGWLAAVQFRALFTDDLYTEIGRHGDAMAARLVDVFATAGHRPLMPSPTNQQFFRLPNYLIAKLIKADIAFEAWGPAGTSESDVRFVTSWWTTDADIAAVADVLRHQ